MQDTLKHLSRWMSSLLRHRVGEAGLRMDAAGWVELDELIAHLGEPRELVDEVVQQNNKTRFEVCGTRIRASQVAKSSAEEPEVARGPGVREGVKAKRPRPRPSLREP